MEQYVLEILSISLRFGIPTFLLLLLSSHVIRNVIHGDLYQLMLHILEKRSRYYGKEDKGIGGQGNYEYAPQSMMIAISIVLILVFSYTQLLWTAAMFMARYRILVGTGVICVFTAILILSYSLAAWRHCRWLLSNEIIAGIIISCIIFIVLAFVVVLYMWESTHLFGLSILFVTPSFIFTLELIIRSENLNVVSPEYFLRKFLPDGISMITTEDQFGRKDSITDHLKEMKTMVFEFELQKEEILSASRIAKLRSYYKEVMIFLGGANLSLLIFSILMLLLKGSHWKFLGFAIWGEIVAVDMLVFLYSLAADMMNYKTKVIILAGARFCLIGFGVENWFFGLCVVFLLLSFWLWDKQIQWFMGSPSLKDTDMQFKPFLRADVDKEPRKINILEKSELRVQKWTSRIGPSVIVLAILNLAFVCCTIIAWTVRERMGTLKIYDTYHEKYVFGITSLLLSIVFALVDFCLRIWINENLYYIPENEEPKQSEDEDDDDFIQNPELELNTKVILVAAMTCLVIWAAGLGLYFVLKSIFALSMMIFLPPLFLLFTYGYQRVKEGNDWDIFYPKYKRPVPEMFFVKALVCGKLPLNDYIMIGIWFCSTACILGLGAVNAIWNPKLGWSLSFIIFELFYSITPIVKYFSSLEFGLCSWIMEGLAVTAHIVYFVCFFLSYFQTNFAENVNWQIGFWLIFIMYPCILLVISGALKYFEDKAHSRFTKIAFAIAGLLFLGFLVNLWILLSWKMAAALTLAVLIVALLLYGFRKWSNYGYYMSKKIQIGLAPFFILVFAMGIFISLNGSSFIFWGVSISWLTFFVMILMFAYGQIAYYGANEGELLFSSQVFPVYMFNPNYRNVVPMNGAVSLFYVSFIGFVVWAMCCTIVYSTSIGLGIMSFLIAYTFSSTRTRQQLLLQQFTNVLDAVTQDIAEKTRVEAAKIQVKTFKIQQGLGGQSIITDLIEDGAPWESVLAEKENLGFFKSLDAFKKYTREEPDNQVLILRKLIALKTFCSSLFEVQARFLATYVSLLMLTASVLIESDKATFMEFARWLKMEKNEDLIEELNTRPTKHWTAEKRQKYRDSKLEFVESKTEAIREEEKKHKEAEIEQKRKESQITKNIIEQKRRHERNIIEQKKKRHQRGKEVVESIEYEGSIADCQRRKYKEILDNYTKTGKKFVDTSFPKSEKSLFREGRCDPRKSGLHKLRFGAWQRPCESENADESKLLLFDDAKSDNIQQGSLGDCYFITSISTIASHMKKEEKCSEALLKIIEHGEYQQSGAYMANFYRMGEEIPVIVDDFIPMDNYGGSMFARSRNKNEIWIQILEKAYAKLHGSYESINGGYIHHCLAELTNGPAEAIDLKTAKKKRETDAVWQKLVQYYEAGYLLGASSNAGNDTEIVDGIAQGHAYAVLEIYSDKKHKLIKLQNPWGAGEWTGDWSDKSDKWTKYWRTKLKQKEQDFGDFWMNFQDFCLHFRSLAVCRLLEPQAIMSSVWSPKNTASWENVEITQQFNLLAKQPCQVYISLKQEYDENDQDEKLEYIAIFVIDSKSENRSKVIKQICQDEVISEWIGFTNMPAVEREVKLKKENYPYKVLALTSKKVEKTIKFHLMFYSKTPLTIEKIEAPALVKETNLENADKEKARIAKEKAEEEIRKALEQDKEERDRRKTERRKTMEKKRAEANKGHEDEKRRRIEANKQRAKKRQEEEKRRRSKANKHIDKERHEIDKRRRSKPSRPNQPEDRVEEREVSPHLNDEKKHEEGTDSLKVPVDNPSKGKLSQPNKNKKKNGIVEYQNDTTQLDDELDFEL